MKKTLIALSLLLAMAGIFGCGGGGGGAAGFIILNGSLPAAFNGIAYGPVTLTSSGGTGTIAWIILTGALPTGLNLNGATGVISGTPTANGSFNVTFQATDSSVPPQTTNRAYTITVTFPAVAITTTSPLPAGVNGTPYAVLNFAATGGSGSYTWDITSGALPASLALSAAGALSGTPTANGTSNFTVRVRDSNTLTNSASKAFVLTVEAQPPVITTASLPNGTAGLPYGPQVLQASGGTPPYNFTISSGEEPAPGFLNPNGTLSGTVSLAETFNLTFQVTDAVNSSSTKVLPVTFSSPAAFDSTGNPSIPAGTHWYGDFTIHSTDTVNIMGASTLNITGQVNVESGGQLVVPGCNELVINLLSRTLTPAILGNVINTCTPETTAGGDLVIRTVHNIQLGDLTTNPGGSISSSGELFIGDPYYAPEPGTQTLTYTNVGDAAAKHPPACALNSNVLSSGGTFPVTVNFTAIHNDADGDATSVTSINYGDGTAAQANPTDTPSHSYTAAGVFSVSIVVSDSDGKLCHASEVINLKPGATNLNTPSAPSVWAGVTPFTAAELIHPVGENFHFTSGLNPPGTTVTWDFGDGTSTSATGDFAMTTPGLHDVVLTAKSPNGVTSHAHLTVFSPLLGGHRPGRRRGRAHTALPSHATDLYAPKLLSSGPPLLGWTMPDL